MPDLGNTSVFSQTDASNATGTMPSWSGTALPSTIDDAGRALQGAITREWNWRNPTLTSTGSANAHVLTFSVAPAALYNGQGFSFLAGYTNTGATTLNINSLGATAIKKLVNGTATALSGGEITAGNIVRVYYNSSASAFLMENVDAVWTQGADVASASTVTLGEGGYFNVTGTTTITALAFSTDKAGRVAVLKFADALTLTHNSTTLILPGGYSITTAANDVAAFVSEGSGNFRCLWYRRASIAAYNGGAPDVIIEDQKASGTNGGTFTAGADRTRTLNTEVRDVYNICTLSSNRFTLPAGTYFIEWSAPAYAVDAHQTLLYNVTGAAEIKRGSSEYTPNSTGVVTKSIGQTTVTISVSSAFEIRHRCQTSFANTGLGFPASFGTEVYTIVKIWKVGA